MVAIVILISTMGALSATLTTTSPNITSSLTVNLVANRPVPMMLNVFSSADYKSCIVTSNIKSFKDKNTQISGMLWIIPTLLQLNKKLYTDSFMLGLYNDSNELYIGPSSNLTVIFFSLSGVGTVTVQFINSTNANGSLLASKQLKESTKNQTVNYIYNGSEMEFMFIEVKILTTGQLTGSYMYNCTIYEIDKNSTLEQSQYICTVNYTNDVCQVPSVYDNNYLFALVTLDGNYPQNHPTMNITSIGRARKIQLLSNVSYSMIFFGIIIVMLLLSLFLCIILFHYRRYRVPYERLN